MIEQRAHRRLAVDFDAYVTTSGSGLRDHPCKVRDFCLGGALLSFDDPLKPAPVAFHSLERGAPVEVRITTRTPGFRDAYTFTASVARRDRLALGVAFSNPDATSLMALQSLANLGTGQYRTLSRNDKRRNRYDEATVRRIVGLVHKQLGELLAPVPPRLYEEARPALEELVKLAGSMDEQSRLLEYIGVLSRNADNLRSTFLQQSLKHVAELEHWQPGAIIASTGSAQRLSLIEKSAFEDWLAIKVMVSRAESECQDALSELQIRLNELFATTLGSQNNPLGPNIFFHALGEPIQKLRLPKTIEQPLFRALEAVMMPALQDAYGRINALLAAEGILPDLELGKYLKSRTEPVPAPAAKVTHEPAPAPVPAAPAPAPTPAATPTPEVPVPPAESAGTPPQAEPVAPASSVTTAASVPPIRDQESSATDRAALPVRQFEMQQRIARQAYATVQRLLSLPRMARAATSATAGAPSSPTAAGPAPQTAAPPDASTAAVAESRQAVDAGGAAAPVWAPEVVEQAISKVQQQPLPEDLGNVVPLRRRIESAIESGKRSGLALPPAQAEAADTIEELFTQMLATPLLRDESKRLIRRLDVPFMRLMLSDPAFLANEAHPARLVLNRLASLGARGGLTTAQQQSSVAEIVDRLARFEQDIAVFDAALDKLDHMLRQQQRIYEHNLERVRQASAGQHRVNAARRKVAQTVEQMLGGRRVPKALLTLLDAGWRESMVSTLLRHGERSEAWREQLDVIAQMLRAPSDPSRINMKGLLGAIKRGLANQAAGQINRDAVISDLREMFTALSSGRVDAITAVDMPVGAVTAATDPDSSRDDATLARWRRRVGELALGDWMAFVEDGGDDAQQARLAWHDEDHAQYVFVNLHGMKVHDLDIDSLARALRDGRAWHIEDPDTPIVNRGLEAMVQKVYGQLSHRATHDELTGLYNRKEFEKRLQRSVASRKAGDVPGLLLWIDLDQFKVINSTGGFEAGDALIREVSRVLAGAAGDEALIARLGGDEFALYVPAGAPDAATAPADALKAAIDAMRFSWQGQVFPVGSSGGVVLVDDEIAPGTDLLKCAEAACYAAKEAGRNRIHLFQPDDKELSRREDVIKWVGKLNQAIEQDRLQLRCQRIEPIDPGSGLPAHYEILIAIRDEGGEFIPPSSFLHAAERYNRMHALDRWVIRNTFRWMHENPAVMARIGGFSINLSGQSLNDANLTAYIFEEVGRSAIAREKVTFEVTETAAISSLADAAEFIREMQRIGCRFSLDDFGSGLSSYSYLKNLPVDYVKIDGVFIRDIDKNPSDYMMVRSINEMAHFMGKRTIAEYVESEAILAKLREIGIDYAQGYGIERPKPLDTLTG